MLGRKASEEELERFVYGDTNGVADFIEKRIILPKEFYTPSGSTSLNWKELAKIKETRGDYPRYAKFKGGFDGFLGEFLQDLTEKGLMTRGQPCKGDYYLINVGGINVKFPDDFDWHGRRAFSTKVYYPRIKEDAEEYAKHFYGDDVYLAQIISVPKSWEIPKKG